MAWLIRIILFAVLLNLGSWSQAKNLKAPLHVGWASVDITPPKPVALVGQLHKRISQNVRDPLTATALALESVGPDGAREQAIMVSCDVLYTRKSVQQKLQSKIQSLLPDFQSEKLFLNATHTHTGPGFDDKAFKGLYEVGDDPKIMKTTEYADFFVERVAEAAVKAWQNRKPSHMNWALGHAMVGMNRRAHYFDGSTKMYGSTDREDFRNIEGYEDHSVPMLFFWNEDNDLTGIVINLACPSQETEGLREISADFWHDVREEIHARFSPDVFVFPQCSAAGDISPHYLLNKQAEQQMRERRKLSSREEIARRIVDTVEEVYPYAKQNPTSELVFKHDILHLDLIPQRETTAPFYRLDPIDDVEIHVLRLGDIAIATNPFELYLDYGIRMKARSDAILTFLVQLSCQHCGYLPTEKAIQGGGYSAVKFKVGPKGGQMLVNKTVEAINKMWNPN